MIAALRNNLRILWNHIKKNFQVKHDQCDSIIFFNRFSLEISQNSMSCSAYLWGGLIKNKGGVGLFQISQKERLFHVLYQPSDNLAMWSPFLHPSKKGLSFPFSLSKKRIYLEPQLKGEFTWKLKISRVLPVPTGRVGIGRWILL